MTSPRARRTCLCLQIKIPRADRKRRHLRPVRWKSRISHALSAKPILRCSQRSEGIQQDSRGQDRPHRPGDSESLSARQHRRRSLSGDQFPSSHCDHRSGWQFDVKLDHQITANHKIGGRYSRHHDVFTAPTVIRQRRTAVMALSAQPTPRTAVWSTAGPSRRPNSGPAA